MRIARASGIQQSLLNLIGTIPVVSEQNEGRVIEVPLEICLPLHYPQEYPVIWVRPELIKHVAADVILRQTEFVDGANGSVRGFENFGPMPLVELISQLQIIFGHQLPIVSSSSIMKVVKVDESPYKSYKSDKSDNSDTGPSLSNKSNVGRLREKVNEALGEKLKGFDEEIRKFELILTKFEEGFSVLNREKMGVNNEMNLLRKEFGVLESNRRILEKELEGSAEREKEDRLAAQPTDPLSSQLLDLISDEAALMDVLYALIKVTVTPVHGESRIPLNVAMRGIRELARKQFLTKCHIKKILTK